MSVYSGLMLWMRGYLLERHGEIPDGSKVAFQEELEITTRGSRDPAIEGIVHIQATTPDGVVLTRDFPGTFAQMVIRVMRDEGIDVSITTT